MRNLAQPPNLLQTNDELREHLVGRLKSGIWWLFITASQSVTAGCLLEIERRFYGGSANADFELAIIPSRLGRPVTAVACARKHRMPARKLACVLTQFMKPEALDTARSALASGRDVLIFGDEGPASNRALQMAFLDFISPGAALRAAMRN